MIHINRAGSNLGIFSEEDVKEGLRSGRFAPTDLGWREGMANWQPLSQFSEFAGGAPTTPLGAPMPQPISVPEPTLRSGLPWDERRARGLFSAYIETLKLVLTSPAAAFARMKREGGLGEPLIYGIIGLGVGFIVEWSLLMFLSSLGTLGESHSPLAHMVGFGFAGVLMIIFAPVIVAIGLFLKAAILHLCLMLVGGAKQPFETTFRVICFTLGSVGPLIMIPFCGGIAAGIWAIVIYIIGLPRAHETDTGRAALAVFLPLIVCCGAWFLMVLIFGGIGALNQH